MSQDIQNLGRVWRNVVDLSVRLLVQDSKRYRQLWPNDVESLKSVLRPGDVILVEGNQRVSQIIKYLTQSSWSHAALYVGDALLHREDGDSIEERFGDDASSLLIEANMESGVCPAPISKYQHFNIRICRPIKLRREDVADVIETVLAQIGTPYNVRHIVGLMRFYFPFSFIPRRWQMTGSRDAERLSPDLICSSQIAMAFQKVRYPIQPLIQPENEEEAPQAYRPTRRRRKVGIFEAKTFAPCDPFLVTPRDFDLSPYFEVVKHSVAGTRDFDYKLMRWVDHQDSPEPASTVETESKAEDQTPVVPAGDAPPLEFPETEPQRA